MRRFLSLVWWLSVCSVCSVGTLRSQPANVQADPTTGVLFRPSAATFISGNGLLTTAAAGSTYSPLAGSTSFTTAGTITTGTWAATLLAGQYGGTGVANTGKTITLGGNITTVGAYNLGVSLSGNTTVTLPTTGTLATLTGSETLTNKTLTTPTIDTITASASTPLTLTGGSTGASLVLGQGTSAKGVFTGGSATGMSLDLVRTTGATTGTFAQFNGYNGSANRAAIIDMTSAGAVDSGQIDFWTKATGAGIAQVARLTSTGNLLIGTTTDMTGSGGLKIAGTTAATTTTSGALIVAGGVGVSGAGYFGGTLSVTGVAAIGTSTDASTALDVRGALTGASQYGIAAQPVFSSGATSSGSTSYFQMRTAGAAYTMATGTVIEIPVPAIGATSVVTTLKGISIANQGAASVTNAYGIDIAAQSGAATTNIGLRNAGVTLLNGALLTGSATLSGAGAIPITTSLVKFTSTAAANALTLANGVDGQRLTIVHDVKGTLGTGILTPTTKTGFSTITFTSAGDTVSLVYVTTRGWMVTGSYLATIAP